MTSLPKATLVAVMSLSLWQTPAPADPLPTAFAPAPQRGERWEARHSEKLRQIAEKGADIDLVFLGDSITQALENPGSAKIVAETFPGKTILNLGYNADRTENVLWRLRNGEIDGISPQAVIILIGTNNTGHRQDPPQITAKGIGLIVDQLRVKLPNAKIVLLSIFPRSDGPGNQLLQLNQQINALLPSLADGKSVFHFDINETFLDANGTVPNDVMPDKLHLSEKGNALWMKALKPRLDQILPAPSPSL